MGLQTISGSWKLGSRAGADGSLDDLQWRLRMSGYHVLGDQPREPRRQDCLTSVCVHISTFETFATSELVGLNKLIDQEGSRQTVGGKQGNI